MDSDYEVWRLNFSLEKMCTVRLIHELIEACRTAAGTLPYDELLNNSVLDKVEQLKFSKELQRRVVGLIDPVILDFRQYYAEIRSIPHKPTLTPQGVVNKEQSIKTLLEDGSIQTSIRFMIACKFCRPYDIPILALLSDVRLNFIDRFSDIALVKFWLDSMDSQLMFREEISAKLFDTGFRAALKGRCDEAMKFFIKSSETDVLRLILRGGKMKKFLSSEIFLPNTYRLAFSKLGESKERDAQLKRAYRLLVGLLKWPYQPFFLEAAKVLVIKDERLFSAIVPRIIEAINANCKDYSYHVLFAQFWDAFRKDLPRLMAIDSNYLKTVFDAFLTKDLFIVRLVIKAIGVKRRPSLMIQFGNSQQCEQLLVSKEYKTIKRVLSEFMRENANIGALEQFTYAIRTRCFLNENRLWSLNADRVAASKEIDTIFDDIKTKMGLNYRLRR